ncbi:MAG: FAD-binding protein, partial [Gammaproteobacteria bacterium]
ILMTEACRGEGGLLLNKDGYRYLQDYGLGPETPVGQPKNKYMELGPRDRLSQAFWHERRKGRTITTEQGEVVHLDLRHLGEAYINERLPLIRDLSIKLVGVDPVKEPIPVLPVIHYTMGGIRTDKHTATDVPGLYAAGECSSVGMHGANRLGSNSLSELLVFGRLAGEQATDFSKQNGLADEQKLLDQAKEKLARVEAVRNRKGEERIGRIRQEMAQTMDDLFGIYRMGEEMEQGLAKLRELRERLDHAAIDDKSLPFNTDLLLALELESGLDVALAVAVSAINRKESRGAHQRLDGFEKRDDEKFLAHSIAWYRGKDDPALEYQPVNITTFPPAERVYGAAGENADH